MCLILGSAEPCMTKMEKGVTGGGGGAPWTSSSKVAPINSNEVAEVPTGTVSLYLG